MDAHFHYTLLDANGDEMQDIFVFGDLVELGLLKEGEVHRLNDEANNEHTFAVERVKEFWSVGRNQWRAEITLRQIRVQKAL
jgi:hypothetical protein